MVCEDRRHIDPSSDRESSKFQIGDLLGCYMSVIPLGGWGCMTFKLAQVFTFWEKQGKDKGIPLIHRNGAVVVARAVEIYSMGVDSSPNIKAISHMYQESIILSDGDRGRWPCSVDPDYPARLELAWIGIMDICYVPIMLNQRSLCEREKREEKGEGEHSKVRG
jgi:hypothetical protein